MVIENERDAILNELLLIEDELSKRKASESHLNNYNKEKVHLKQMAFHKCQKRNRWVFGGNRCGKTECGAVESIWLARGIHPFRQNRENVFGWVVSPSFEVQRDVAQRKLLYYLPKSWIADVIMSEGRKDSCQNGIIDQIVIYNVFGGTSTIGFKSHEQGREKFQGSSLDFVWFDEEPPKDIYEECLMRVMDKKGDIFGTMTPLKGVTFLYNEVVLNKSNNCEMWHEFMSWQDNPYLPKSEITLLENTLSSTSLDARKFGKFSSNAGLVYPEFNDSNIIEPFDIPLEWQDNISIDPGLNHAFSCHWYAVDYDGNIYVIAEHYKSNRDIDYHTKQILDISKRLNWHTYRGKLQVLIDSAGNQRTLASSKSVCELLSERGLIVNSNVNKELFTGINRVKSYLKGECGKLYIFNTCTNLIRELYSYNWGKDDRPVKVDDHALDELRYYIMSKPQPPKMVETLSPITRDIIRRINANERKKEH